MVLAIRDEEGHLNEAYVRAITPDSVQLDFNHPLAGQALYFSVQVVGLRDATVEEVEHGHPHGIELDEEFEDDEFDDEMDFEFDFEDDEEFDDDEYEDDVEGDA